MISHQPLKLLAGVTGYRDRSDTATNQVLPRRQIAMISASVTSCAVIVTLIDQPTTRPREEINDGRHVEPALGRPDISEISNPFAVRRMALRRFGPGRWKRRRSALPFTQIRRQATPSRTCSERLKAASTARSDEVRHGMPSASMSCHTRLAPWVRSLARKLARTFAPSLFVAPGALTPWPCQPGHGTHPRETPSAPHNHSAGQIPRCFAMKLNFTSAPSRSRPWLFFRISRFRLELRDFAFSAARSRPCPLRASAARDLERHVPDRPANAFTRLRRNRSMNAEIARRLRDTHAALPDQAAQPQV